MKVEEAIKSGKFYTYVHIRNDNNKVFYVGKGKGRRVLGKTSRNRWWENIADKHGFHAEILFIHYDETSSFKAEEFFIKSFREQGYDLVNQTDGGEGASGCKRSDDTKLKLSIAKTGLMISNETRSKISDANKGINNAFYNAFGVNHPAFKGFIIGKNKNDGKFIVLDGANSMKNYGFDSSYISKCVNGVKRYNSHKGFTFIRTLDKAYLKSLLNEDNFYDFNSKELIIKFIEQ